jgi:hypothetical protein
VTTELSIFTVYGRNNTYTLRPAITRFTQDGRIGEQDAGFRLRPTNHYGKRIDPDTGDVVVGIRRPGLTAGFKARRNRAQAEFILSDAVAKARANGYPEMTERDILGWFLDKHGEKLGVTWNVYETVTGKQLSPEDIERAAGRAGRRARARKTADPAPDTESINTDPYQGSVESSPSPLEAVEEKKSNPYAILADPDFDDSEYLVKDEDDGLWWCTACNISMVKGMSGHRRSNAHRENVLALLKEGS